MFFRHSNSKPDRIFDQIHFIYIRFVQTGNLKFWCQCFCFNFCFGCFSFRFNFDDFSAIWIFVAESKMIERKDNISFILLYTLFLWSFDMYRFFGLFSFRFNLYLCIFFHAWTFYRWVVGLKLNTHNVLVTGRAHIHTHIHAYTFSIYMLYTKRLTYTFHSKIKPKPKNMQRV